jgi:S-adenosyl-L-methionine hydrolase (adenosine-forming)
MPAIITLTSDFGGKDAFAASMKGVILKINPQTQIIDISNEINPQDIWEAAYVLRSAYSHFPKGTVHVAVVDPGVGSGRRPIIVVTESYYFVGPDNGLFTLIYQEAERIRVHHITSTHYYLPNPGPTFHGRDIFAPVAGWLAKGIASANFGDEITDYVKMNTPLTKTTPNSIDGHIVHIDRFGNIITNITYKEIQLLSPDGVDLTATSVSVAGKSIKGLKKFYAEAAPGEPGAIINSSGALEIFMYKQNARTSLSVKRGESVRLMVSR